MECKEEVSEVLMQYAGLMKEAFGDEKRFGQLERLWHGQKDVASITDLLKGDDIHRQVSDYAKLYCLRDWLPTPPQYLVTITGARPELGALELLQLKFVELFNHERFRSELPTLVQLTFRRIGND